MEAHNKDENCVQNGFRPSQLKLDAAFPIESPGGHTHRETHTFESALLLIPIKQKTPSLYPQIPIKKDFTNFFSTLSYWKKLWEAFGIMGSIGQILKD